MFTPTKGIPYSASLNGELDSNNDCFWAEICTSSADSAVARRTSRIARKAYMINQAMTKINKERFPDDEEGEF
jgi:hypothetical protein